MSIVFSHPPDTDPTGLVENPVFDATGKRLGNDSEGWEGEAIIMDEADFEEGMDHDEALAKGTLLSQYAGAFEFLMMIGKWLKIMEVQG